AAQSSLTLTLRNSTRQPSASSPAWPRGTPQAFHWLVTAPLTQRVTFRPLQVNRLARAHRLEKAARVSKVDIMVGALGESIPRAGARGAPPRFRGRLGDCTRDGRDILGIDVLLRGRLIGLEVAEAIVVGLGIDVQVGLLGLPGGVGSGELGNGCRGRVGGMPGHAPGRTLAST